MSETQIAPTELLQFSVLSYTANELAIKVKNISGSALEKTLVIEICPPLDLVSNEIDEAAQQAPFSKKPIGSASLGGIVTGPEGSSAWVRLESSGSSVILMFVNDLTQAGEEKKPPVKLPAGAEFTIRIPLNPSTERGDIDLLYSYLHGSSTTDQFNGKLVLKSGGTTEWTPDVTLRTDHASPTMVTPGDPVTIFWHIKDGVNATLRGPLPGGNSELKLTSTPGEPFQISDGSIDVRVGGPMTYVLQAEVKRPGGQPNFQVVKMLSLDTSNHKYLYLNARPDKVLPFGLVEIDWAAWGVKQVSIEVSDHTTRNIPLTQQTKGRFLEGSGVMRTSAIKTPPEEIIDLKAPLLDKRDTRVKVITWKKMTRPSVTGHPWGLAVVAPYMALVTFQGLYIARVGSSDPSIEMTGLPFIKKTEDRPPTEWAALTALEKEERFVCLRRVDPNPDFEVAPFTIDGTPDVIPPFTLPPEVRNLALSPKAVFDFVGFDKRVYVVVETPQRGGLIRRAYSVGFNPATKKSDYRPEPMIERLLEYRLVSFDDALYAFNRKNGDMFRFELTNAGTLNTPSKAAPAVKKDEENRMQAESMISKGLIVPVGRVLAVLSPTCVPSVASLEQYGLKNTLKYEQTIDEGANPQKIPQDLFYNPQKNYWGRCGHDEKFQLGAGAVAAFRGGGSPRLWVIQPEGDAKTPEAYTLAVGSESLFVHDYMPDFPTQPLAAPVIKECQFSIKCAPVRVTPINDIYRRGGLVEFSTVDPTAKVPQLPTRGDVSDLGVKLTYDAASPAPVTIRQQVLRSTRALPNVDYLLEVTFSGENLSTATSCYRRVTTAQNQLFSSEEVDGTRMVHSSSAIQVPRPRRFEDRFRFVVVNGSKGFRLKTNGLQSGPNYIFYEPAIILLDYETPDFSLQFDGGGIPTSGVITVNLNFALPHGIEATRGVQAQTKLIRLNIDNVQKIQFMVMTMLAPGAPPLILQGVPPIESKPNEPVYVCQLTHQNL